MTFGGANMSLGRLDFTPLLSEVWCLRCVIHVGQNCVLFKSCGGRFPVCGSCLFWGYFSPPVRGRNEAVGLQWRSRVYILSHPSLHFYSSQTSLSCCSVYTGDLSQQTVWTHFIGFIFCYNLLDSNVHHILD